MHARSHRRDAWCRDKSYQKVWILSEILYLMMVDGESSGAFTPSAHEVCPVSRETFLEMDRSTTFYHIHPCATHHRLEFVRPRPRSRVGAARVPA